MECVGAIAPPASSSQTPIQAERLEVSSGHSQTYLSFAFKYE